MNFEDRKRLSYLAKEGEVSAFISLAQESKHRGEAEFLSFSSTLDISNLGAESLISLLGILTDNVDSEFSSHLAWVLSEIEDERALRWIYGYAVYTKNMKLGLKILQKLTPSWPLLFQIYIEDLRQNRRDEEFTQLLNISLRSEDPVKNPGVFHPNSFLETGSVFAPFIDLYVSPTISFEMFAYWKLIVEVIEKGPLLLTDGYEIEGHEIEVGDLEELKGLGVLSQDNSGVLRIGSKPPFPKLPKCLHCFDPFRKNKSCLKCNGLRWLSSWDEERSVSVMEMCDLCLGTGVPSCNCYSK